MTNQSNHTKNDDAATQLLILGAGPGGYVAAFRAADMGLDVTLVDPRADLGGVCLHEGCIPSKTLLHAARTIRQAEEADVFGITFSQPRIDIDKLRRFSRDVIESLSKGLRSSAKSRDVTVLKGAGRFIDEDHVEVKSDDGATRTITFEHAVIATGSNAAPLPNVESDLDPESTVIMTAADALALPDVPNRLLVIGGGYIGLEMATVYGALGSRVTVIELTDELLPGVDRDLAQPLHDRLESQLEQIMLRTRATHLKRYRHGVEVTLENADGETFERKFQNVLVAVGRTPNTQDLGLENVGVTLDDNGFITVDPQRCTTAEKIYAIGDVTGEPLLAHKATHEGRVVAEVIAGEPAAFAPHAIPAVVFTDPQIAWAGLTEREARRRGVDVNVERFDWRQSGRAWTMNRTDGVTKLITQPRTGRILGAGVTGIEAGELIAEAALAIEAGLTLADVAQTIHAHPTLAESLMETARNSASTGGVEQAH